MPIARGDVCSDPVNSDGVIKPRIAGRRQRVGTIIHIAQNGIERTDEYSRVPLMQ